MKKRKHLSEKSNLPHWAQHGARVNYFSALFETYPYEKDMSIAGEPFPSNGLWVAFLDGHSGYVSVGCLEPVESYPNVHEIVMGLYQPDSSKKNCLNCEHMTYEQGADNSDGHNIDDGGFVCGVKDVCDKEESDMLHKMSQSEYLIRSKTCFKLRVKEVKDK